MPRPALLPALILLVLAVLWSFGWFVAASWLKRTADEQFAGLASRGIVVFCPERSVSGFPFALRLSCAGITVRQDEQRAHLASATAGGAVWRPRTLAIEIDGPATYAPSQDGQPARFAWDEAGFDVRVGLDGLAGLVGSAASLRAELPEAAAQAERLVARLAAGPAGTSRIIAEAKTLAFEVDGQVSPPLDAQLSARLSLPPERLPLVEAEIRRSGLRISELALTAASGAVRLAASGDLAVDRDGLLNGRLAVQIAGAEQLPALLAGLPEQLQALGNAAAGAVMAIGRPNTLDGAPSREIVVEIERGALRLGFFELGRVPAL